MTARIAINGFGRIGRASYKIAFDKPDTEIVAINDLTNPRVLAHLLKYDTAYGTYDKDIGVEEDGVLVKLTDQVGDKEFFTKTGKVNYLVVDGKKTLVLAQKDATQLPWQALAIDVVIECTGRFTDNDSALVHITSGAKKVVISAPTKGGTTQTFLRGVNDGQYLGQNIISNASCTTNCISPVIAVMHREFKVVKAVMTTIHALTNNQTVVDSAPMGADPDMRRTRAAGYNMSPTTTGAAKATTLVIPELQGLFDGVSVRVPIITGSLSDITMVLKRKVTVQEVNDAFIKAKDEPQFKGILTATYEPICSSDVIGTTYSAIVDLLSTKVVDGDLVKVMAWYDNEWGYSNRLVEMALMMVL
jgi:glyceraldehyde 3-phosphate dehydrogenase